MNKPQWRDKWRALRDMRAARNVAAGTISADMMMAQVSALDAITTKKEQQIRGNPRYLAQNPAQEVWEEYAKVYKSWRQEMYLTNSYLKPISQFQNSYEQEQSHEVKTPSPSSITPSKEPPAVFKSVPMQVTGKTTPNTSIPAQQSTLSHSTITTQMIDEW